MAAVFALFFKSNDTGPNVGKAPYLSAPSPGITLTNFILHEGRNDCTIYFAIAANTQGLTQGNFNTLSDSASGNCVGYIETPTYTFVPREGFAYFESATNDVVVHLVGEKPRYF